MMIRKSEMNRVWLPSISQVSCNPASLLTYPFSLHGISTGRSGRDSQQKENGKKSAAEDEIIAETVAKLKLIMLRNIRQTGKTKCKQ